MLYQCVRACLRGAMLGLHWPGRAGLCPIERIQVGGVGPCFEALSAPLFSSLSPPPLLLVSQPVSGFRPAAVAFSDQITRRGVLVASGLV